MKDAARLLPLSLFSVLVLSGCTQKTPVDEVSPATSKVSFSERDLSHLDDQWPAWRGPNQSGVVTDQKIPVTWNETEHIKWRVPVPGRGHSSPVVVNDRIYLATALNESEQQQVLAYDVKNGQLLWQQTIHEKGFPGSGQMHRKSSHANGTVACDGERVYMAFLNNGQIHATALDAESGDVVWTNVLGAFNSKFGYAP